MKNQIPPLDTDAVSTSIGYLLRRASRRLREITMPVLRDHDLSRLELTTLILIHSNPECILRSLAEAVAVDPPAMNRIVNNLEGNGLITRRKSASDARYTHFSVSPAGRTVIDQASPPVIDVENKALAALSPDEREALFNALHKLTIKEQGR